MIIETERTYMRQMTKADYDNLCLILQDKAVMYAYEHAFSDREVDAWLAKQMQRYEDYGFGLWAVILKSNGEFIGQCGLTMQDCLGEQVLEVGYLFRKQYWGSGYATECAVACKQYAFDKLNAEEVYSIIRDNNLSSQRVARRNGMTEKGRFVKHYYEIDMPHLIFSVKRK